MTIARLTVALLLLLTGVAAASVGLTELPGKDSDGPVTVFYPSAAEARPTQRGPFTLTVAASAPPVRGNGRLVVISHGSGGAPWVHADLARALVEAGFVVALPEHRGDNYKDTSMIGPKSWKIRPLEVSRAIDVVGADARFAPLLSLDKVGLYGMSAGGHTALTLAGGRWSPSRIAAHCEAHIGEDFQSCVGLATQLRGNMLDPVKKTIALWLIRYRAKDPAWYTHSDPRIAAIVAAVPFAVDFDPASLASPRVPLGLVTAGKDAWLVPRFHSDVIAAACATCERVADLPTGGHGSVLSPPPPGLTGLAAELLYDPPGFDRSQLPAVDRKVAGFFLKHLTH